MPQTYVLIISHDVVGQHMAGPGIRYFHLARIINQYVPVVLAVPASSPELPLAPFLYERYNAFTWGAIAPLAQEAKVVVVSNVLAQSLLPLAGKVPVVIDGYDPVLAENLAFGTYLPPDQLWSLWRSQMEVLQSQYELGDFFICASERQRDWWLGLLEANGRINPATVRADPSLRQLLDVVPFGLPTQLPRHEKFIIKGVWPGIASDDILIVWGGGLWPWLDPLTAIRAIAQLAPEWPALRLVFPGTRHPNTNVAQDVPTHNQAAVALAQELGVLERQVFFGDWIPYPDWGAALLESAVALSLHMDTFETRLAFRSRILEYIWAGLPIVATVGDATAELIEHYGLGWTTPPGDVGAVARAIQRAITQPPPLKAFETARAELNWERVARPLIEFCRQPHFSSDVQQRLANGLAGRGAEHLQRELAQARADLQVYRSGRVARSLRWVELQMQRLGLVRAKTKGS